MVARGNFTSRGQSFGPHRLQSKAGLQVIVHFYLYFFVLPQTSQHSLWVFQHPTHLGNVPPSYWATPRAMNPGLRRQIKTRVKNRMLKVSLSLWDRKISWNADERSETAMSYRFALFYSWRDWALDPAGTSWGTFHSSASGEGMNSPLKHTNILIAQGKNDSLNTRAVMGSFPPGTAATTTTHTSGRTYDSLQALTTASRIKVAV